MKIFNVNDKNAIEAKAYELLDDHDVINIIYADGTEQTIIERHVPETVLDMMVVEEIDECPFCYAELSADKICEECEIQFVDEPWEEEKQND